MLLNLSSLYLSGFESVYGADSAEYGFMMRIRKNVTLLEWRKYLDYTCNKYIPYTCNNTCVSSTDIIFLGSVNRLQISG